jgi:uncharacterized protein (TIGR02611 family)
MERAYHWWKRVPSTVRKPLILIIGIAIVVTGIAMLVLPGPGWAAIFLGFAVLATEFAAAEKVRDWLVQQLKYLIQRAKILWEKRSKKK